jgi:hypothetical protein
MFAQQFPLSTALGLKLVKGPSTQEQPGFDYDEVLSKIGQTRVNNLLAQCKRVFSCGHRNWPGNHATANWRNAEVHCFYAEDLESFLKAGG